MLFNSFTFIVFLILFFALWPFAARHSQRRWLYIVIASFVFYGWWNWKFLFLIVGSGLLDFYAALLMQKYPRHKKIILVFSIIGNIGSLAVFKYLFFFTSSLQQILLGAGAASLAQQVPLISLTLPIGISFYTFQSMSYTIDVYKNDLKPTRSVLHFFAYLSLFPQLVAGPIIRASDLLPQLTQWHPPSESKRWEGFKLIVFGYFKKVVLADTLAPVVNAAFGASTPADSLPYWWVITTMFAIQIYCDFSGYTDIARGLAKWMGYEFNLNFNHPYLATSFRDFWNRWHISLSTWFRDYVYIPLGGSQKGKVRTHVNTWTTMLLSGLWHGANWTFIAWGGVHSFFLTFERLTKWPQRVGRLIGGRLILSVLLLMQVWVAWVFFRAETLTQALKIVLILFDVTKFDFGPLMGLPKISILFMAFSILIEACFLFDVRRNLMPAFKILKPVEPVFIAFLITACIFLRGTGSQFIYFQF